MKVVLTLEEAKSAIRAATVAKLNNAVDVRPDTPVRFVHCHEDGETDVDLITPIDRVEVDLG